MLVVGEESTGRAVNRRPRSVLSVSSRNNAHCLDADNSMESELNPIRVFPEEDNSCMSKCVESCLSLCCCVTDDKIQRYTHVQYRPITDLSQPPHVTADEVLCFPQSGITIWPQHRRSIQAITEEPQSTPTFSRQASVRAKLSSTESATQFPSFQPPSLPPPDFGEAQNTNEPTLNFALFYDMQMRVLRVYIKFASNLDALQVGHVHRKNCDSSISAFLLPNKDEILQVCNKYTRDNPLFNKKMEFSGILASDLRQQTLVIHLHDYRTLIGIVKVPLGNADLLGHVICKKIESSAHSTEVM